MQRNIEKELLKWKKEKNRKALLVRGARQVGKTYSIRKLGEKFKYFLEVNFEENPKVETFFEKSLNPQEICEKLAAYFNVKIMPGQTLLFFDEIQACQGALKSLRFFYEKMPELHVAAAGSLLEFTISEIPSFGVGRIKSFFMYPMTFNEFLTASGNSGLQNIILSSSSKKPVDTLIHEKILEYFKIFQIIGGMPEVVEAYLLDKDLRACQIVLDNLITSLIDDFAKYKNKYPAVRLQEVFKSIVFQTGSKFKYVNISQGNALVYKDALELLLKAGLAYKVFHTSAQGLPLGAQINRKKFKTLIFDTGIYQRILGLDLSQYIISDYKNIINKGNLSELFVGLELIAAQSHYIHPEIYYWHREAKSSNAEIDYIISNKGQILPIEVKAGTKGQMQSMHLFLNERNLEKGIRISQENFDDYGKIITIPIYAVNRIFKEPNIISENS
jgi:predicted AAA+ superfamily ATPase